MATDPFPHVVSHLRRVARPARVDAPDGELLERFVATRDEGAFALLVHRHGPMVLGVCRRVLRNHADAEDASQAVFLILARKAGSVRPPAMLAGWLHGVARNVARRAQRMVARRRRHERIAGAQPRPAIVDADLRTVIDQELDRLPAPFRVAVVLCDLEGLTRSEAAARLGWAEGTVGSRLARGRRVLGRRLLRAGLGTAAGVAVFELPELSAAFTESIVRVGTADALVAPPPVRVLTHGALRAMSLKRYALIAAAGLLVAGLGLTVRHTLPSAAAHVSTAGVSSAAPAVLQVKDDDGISLKTVPPVVVKTIPAAGTADVDPGLGEIKVTFSKDMTDKSWSWSQLSDDTFPKPVGDKPIHYEKDMRTCVLKVKLEPGKTYAIWVNSDKFANFKDSDDRPAVPYLLVFQTRKAD